MSIISNSASISRLDFFGCRSFSRTGVIALALLAAGISTLRAEPVTFSIASNSSSISLTGADINGTVFDLPGSVVGLMVMPQGGASSVTTTYSGSITTDLDLGNGTVQFISGDINADEGGLFYPGPAGSGSALSPGNYGFTMAGEGTLFPLDFLRLLNVTNFSLGLTSPILPLATAGADYNFDLSGLTYAVSTGTVGIGYDTIPGPTQHFPLAGSVMDPIPTSVQGVISNLGGGDYELRLHFTQLLPLDPSIFNLVAIGHLPVSIRAEGEIVATAHIPEVNSIGLALAGAIVLVSVVNCHRRLTMSRST